MDVHLSATRSTALWLLIGAFVVGGIVGFTADRVVTKHRTQPPVAPPDRHTMRQKLFDDLHATPTQRVALDSIFDARARAESTLWAPVWGPMMVRIDSLNRATGELVKKQLDPDQQPIFDRIVAKMRAHRMGGPHGGPPPPPPPATPTH